jgi:hypothetical protein
LALIVQVQQLCDDELRDSGNEGHPQVDDAIVEEEGGKVGRRT